MYIVAGSEKYRTISESTMFTVTYKKMHTINLYWENKLISLLQDCILVCVGCCSQSRCKINEINGITQLTQYSSVIDIRINIFNVLLVGYW